MGGPPTPGIGFGIGIERVLIACDAEGVVPGDRADRLDVFVVDGLGDGAPRSPLLVTELREDGLRAERAVRRPVGEGADEGGRPVGARVYGVMLGRAEAGRDGPSR